MVKTKLECATSRRALGDMKNVPVTRATKQSTGRIVRNEGGNPKVVKITDKQVCQIKINKSLCNW